MLYVKEDTLYVFKNNVLCLNGTKIILYELIWRNMIRKLSLGKTSRKSKGLRIKPLVKLRKLKGIRLTDLTCKI